jgi:hypothetical protein
MFGIDIHLIIQGGGDIMGLIIIALIVAFFAGAGCYWYFIVKRKYVKIDTK